MLSSVYLSGMVLVTFGSDVPWCLWSICSPRTTNLVRKSRGSNYGFWRI